MTTKIELILLGKSGVGKTTVLNRFRFGDFRDPGNPTVMMEFFTKKINREGLEITISLWDPSGQEQFRALVKSYYRKADGVLLMYDVTEYESFLELSHWLEELRNTNEEALVLIAGNKNDDPTKKAVTLAVVKSFAEQQKLEYMEVSAMTGENIEEAFDHLIKKILISRGLTDGIVRQMVNERPPLMKMLPPGSRPSSIIKLGQKSEPPENVQQGGGWGCC